MRTAEPTKSDYRPQKVVLGTARDDSGGTCAAYCSGFLRKADQMTGADSGIWTASGNLQVVRSGVELARGALGVMATLCNSATEGDDGEIRQRGELVLSLFSPLLFKSEQAKLLMQSCRVLLQALEVHVLRRASIG